MEGIKEEQTVRMTLDTAGLPLPVDSGEGFLILAITAGNGNGWNFTPDVLQRSLALWDGIDCFVDHAPPAVTLPGRSVRDLGGVCSSPEWDELKQGIRLKLTPAGPSAEVIRSLGQEMLEHPGAVPRVGFSADLLLRAAGFPSGGQTREVQEIVKVLSVDLVHNPARGGAFLQALSEGAPTQPCSDKGEPQMSDDGIALTGPAPLDLCGRLLEAKLTGSPLPSLACDQIRLRFSGKVFNPDELDNAVESARALVSGLTGG